MPMASPAQTRWALDPGQFPTRKPSLHPHVTSWASSGLPCPLGSLLRPWVHIHDLRLKDRNRADATAVSPGPGCKAQEKPLWGGFGHPLPAVPALLSDPLQVCGGKVVQSSSLGPGLSAKPH